MSDWAKVRRKVNQGKEWRGTANIPIDDETYQVAHRMLTEEEQLKLLPRLNLESLLEHKKDGESEEEQRVQELQKKDELTDEESEELQSLQDELRLQRVRIMSDLGEETFKALQDAGLWCIVPDDEDIEQHVAMSPDEQEKQLGFLPEGADIRGQVEEALKDQMKEVLTDNPYPIKFTLGQQVFAESNSALGNGQTE